MVQEIHDGRANSEVHASTRTNIDDLSAEILGSIFSLLVLRPVRKQGGLRPIRYTNRAPEWAVVTYVCSRWRKVALNTPTLWCYINIPENICGKRWLAAIIERSQSAPLDVDIYAIDNDRLDLGILALEQIHRIRELWINVQHQRTPKMPFSSLTRPAPALERLELNTNERPSFVEPFLGGHAPRLHHFHINSSTIPMDLSMLSNLTALRLQSAILPASVSLNDFITTLGDTPNLLDLALSWSCPVPSNTVLDQAHEHPIVHLPHLRTLSLCENIGACTILLVRLQYPSSEVSLQVQAFIDDEEWPRFEDAAVPLSRLSNALSPKCTATVRCLRLSNVQLKRMQIEAWCNGGGSHASRPTSNPSTVIDIALPDYRLPEYHAQEVLKILLAVFPLYSLETLHVEAIPVEPHVWRTLFGGISTLQNVNLEGVSATNFAKALDPDEQSFGNLQNLVAKGWSQVSIWRSNATSDANTIWLQSLEAWLNARNKKGARLKKLLCRRSELSGSPDFLKRIRAYVDEVELSEDTKPARTRARMTHF